MSYLFYMIPALITMTNDIDNKIVKGDYTLVLENKIYLQENILSTSNEGPFSNFLFTDEYIYNYTTKPTQIVSYNYNGEQKHKVGREGEGPGEYRTIYSLNDIQDGIIAFNEGGRAIEFGESGDMVDEFTHNFRHPASILFHNNKIYVITSDLGADHHIVYESVVDDTRGEFFDNISRKDRWLRTAHYGGTLEVDNQDCLMWVLPTNTALHRMCRDESKEHEIHKFESELFKQDKLEYSDNELRNDPDAFNSYVSNVSASLNLFQLNEYIVIELLHNQQFKSELIILDQQLNQTGNIVLDSEFRATYGSPVGTNGELLYLYKEESKNGEIRKSLEGYSLKKAN